MAQTIKTKMVISYTVDPLLYDKVKAHSAASNRTMSDQTREIVQRYFEKVERSNPETNQP